MPESRDTAKPDALKEEVEAVEFKSAEESQMAVALVNNEASSNNQAKSADSSGSAATTVAQLLPVLKRLAAQFIVV